MNFFFLIHQQHEFQNYFSVAIEIKKQMGSKFPLTKIQMILGKKININIKKNQIIKKSLLNNKNYASLK